jgi:ribosomal protein S18 acetylase RimI-like enzyme
VTGRDGESTGLVRGAEGIGSGVEIRDAEPVDARGIATVNVRAWRAAYRGLLPDDVLAGLSVPEREQFWSHLLTARPAHTCVVVAVIADADADAVVGFAACGPPLVTEDRADPALGDLYAIYVEPDLWRRGVGTHLHDGAVGRLRSSGYTRSGLWLLEGNERALRFYDRHGWTPTGRTQIDRGPGGVALQERRLHRDLLDGGRHPPRGGVPS